MGFIDLARRVINAVMEPSVPQGRIDIGAELTLPAREGLGLSAVCVAAEYMPTPDYVFASLPQHAWNTFRVATSIDGRKNVTSISREQLDALVENFRGQVQNQGEVTEIPPLPKFG
jgi:hypothetical protein